MSTVSKLLLWLAHVSAPDLRHLSGLFGAETDLDTLAMTLVCGLNHRSRQMAKTVARLGYQAWTHVLRSTGGFAPAFSEYGIVPEHTNLPLPESEVRKAMKYERCFMYGGYDKTLFCTADGHLGVGPQHMSIVDVVAILWGCPWPVILRPLPLGLHEYEFVGVAYIHGIMYGEAVTEHEAVGTPEEWFHIK